MNILIIEPSRLLQYTLEKIFKPYATTLHITESGRQAREIQQQNPIDFICLSFYLQDMDGVDFISEVRTQEWGGETIPILMLTSKKDQKVAEQTIRGGATEIFQKDNLAALENYLQLYAEHARQQASLSGDVLLIDSDMIQAQEILDYFINTQLRFIHFTSAEQAADIVRAAEFDMVITNAILSGSMTARALIREIREINDTMYRVPILAITEATNVSQRLELLRAGANDSIQKPILLEELSIRVKSMIQNKQLFDTVELQKQQLEELAVKDPLTKLYNRHYLLHIIDDILRESFRHKFPVTLLVLDLDHFKQINDTWGHSSGDLVLQGIANLLLKTIRDSDKPIRYGGEEFLILLPHCKLDDGCKKAEKLRAQIEALNPAEIPVTVSIGVAQTSFGSHISFEQLFGSADKALYKAKAAGRNCVIASSDHEESSFKTAKK